MWPGVALLALLGVADLLHRAVRRVVPDPSRPDGAPSLPLVRLTAAVDIGLAALLLLAPPVRHLLPLPGLSPEHDPLRALFVGAVGGLFLHLVGSGSPLPVAALRPGLGLRGAGSSGPGTAGLFLAGEVAAEVVWRGVALGMLWRILPGPLALLLSAAAYGSRRASAGQDHALLGVVDGILLGVLYRFSGSLLAVSLAHLTADVYAYAAAVQSADEELVIGSRHA